VCAVTHAGAACTGFAVYSGSPLFGMNFDYPPNEIRFSIEQSEAGALFIGSFWMGEHYGRTVGMNEHGLFSSNQMVFPPRAGVAEPTEDELFIWNAFYDGLGTCTSVDEVLTWIGDRRVVQYESLHLHNLYADPAGHAMVLECGEAGNVITKIAGSFLVMTNFHNGDFEGLDLRDIAGDGAERYRVAHRTIEERFESFDIYDGFETLRRTAQSAGSYRTRYSLVFDPESLEIYIALERDYNHIWKVSLANRTIETHHGFDAYVVLPLDDIGITGPVLQAHAGWEPAPVVRDQGGLRWPLLLLIAGGLLGAAYLLLSKR